MSFASAQAATLAVAGTPSTRWIGLVDVGGVELNATTNRGYARVPVLSVSAATDFWADTTEAVILLKITDGGRFQPVGSWVLPVSWRMYSAASGSGTEVLNSASQVVGDITQMIAMIVNHPFFLEEVRVMATAAASVANGYSGFRFAARKLAMLYPSGTQAGYVCAINSSGVEVGTRQLMTYAAPGIDENYYGYGYEYNCAVMSMVWSHAGPLGDVTRYCRVANIGDPLPGSGSWRTAHDSLPIRSLAGDQSVSFRAIFEAIDPYGRLTAATMTNDSPGGLGLTGGPGFSASVAQLQALSLTIGLASGALVETTGGGYVRQPLSTSNPTVAWGPSYAGRLIAVDPIPIVFPPATSVWSSHSYVQLYSAGASLRYWQGLTDLAVPDGTKRLVVRPTPIAFETLSGTLALHVGIAFLLSGPTTLEEVFDPPAPTVTVSPGSPVEYSTAKTVAVVTPDPLVTRADFYVDGVLLGSRSAAPWGLSWPTPAAAQATKTVTAKLSSEFLTGPTSDPAYVTLVPSAAATVVAGNVRVAGAALQVACQIEAGSPVVSVAFKVDGTTIATTTSYPYQAQWAAVVGIHNLTAVVAFASGTTMTTAAVPVTIAAATNTPGGWPSA